MLSRIATRVSRQFLQPAAMQRSMGTITQGVEFDTIAREWRCKWSKDDDMKSLQEAQKVLDEHLSDLKATNGCKSVHRIVCGGNLDFKVITSISADNFSAWSDAGFPPEDAFLNKLKSIDGISNIETQTYTFMEV